MTIVEDSGKTRRMGRPPLKANTATVITTVRLTADVVAVIDSLAAPQTRTEFIREAIEREIKRRSRKP